MEIKDLRKRLSSGVDKKTLRYNPYKRGPAFEQQKERYSKNSRYSDDIKGCSNNCQNDPSLKRSKEDMGNPNIFELEDGIFYECTCTVVNQEEFTIELHNKQKKPLHPLYGKWDKVINPYKKHGYTCGLYINDANGSIDKKPKSYLNLGLDVDVEKNGRKYCNKCGVSDCGFNSDVTFYPKNGKSLKKQKRMRPKYNLYTKLIKNSEEHYGEYLYEYNFDILCQFQCESKYVCVCGYW